ncbi:DEAD/DEAH box helicase family protein [Periweissella fabaria]|uniref:ComF operon protein 1 n=1 Tax=Periweissella fabaria TaxID=546157 RepID=A0ABM8Z593_9LACO|nr:DEAD/DEAH box helicase family protein [Periweissella fabaria]MCM0596808.1 DEAD/DEAH box helicase family protein [Periweissella fabaria]CAH0416545.1 ComF operon protein 1 [Periweissella fabaria]
MQMSNFYGRLLVIGKEQFDANQVPRLIGIPAIKNKRCQRCFNKVARQWQLPNGEQYCRWCLQFGRLTTKQMLVTIAEPNSFPIFTGWQWDGTLTPAQQRVVNEIQSHQQNHLIWAVTGAGKTEILFPIIAQALHKQQRICLAAPRIDVILELVPRITAVFPTISTAILYGKAKEPYRYSQLVICTTHQLINFRAAFDLLIIDEIDSFPFANNAMLKYVPKLALKENGRLIAMTATPSYRHLLTFCHRSYLPARFHGFALPTIKRVVVPKWRQLIKNNQLPPVLAKYLKHNGQAQQCLIFVPTIREVALVEKAIQQRFGNLKVMGVSAQDPERIQKVQLMRAQQIQYLVTTTILERGVTLPDIDVIILGADHVNFTSRSLIQIAGRVGRKVSRPTGLVLAIVSQPSWQVWLAQITINWLNYQARKGDKHEL